MRDEEATAGAWEAAKGAVIGATKWGVGTAIFGAAMWGFSPIYRGLTFQFRVFIQMSGMILGGCLDADRRLREYEAKVRVRKRLGMDQTAWEQYELEFAEMRAREQRAAAAAANKDN